MNTQLQEKLKTKLYVNFQNWHRFHQFPSPNPQRDSELLEGVSPADIAAAAEKAEAATKVNTAAGGNFGGEETGMRDIVCIKPFVFV